MQQTPKGLRLQIGIFGRRNTGKSSLLNAIVRQQVVIVSDFPGTTTDPVEKPMEMLPLGPVLLIDTAGMDDDAAEIGIMRVERSKKILDRVDMALLVATANDWCEFDEHLLGELKSRNIPTILVLNQCDIHPVSEAFLQQFRDAKCTVVSVSALTGEGLPRLRDAMIQLAPDDFLSSFRMLGDLVKPKAPVLLITPIDLEAPKGRMILPQVQAIRDTLDHDAYCLVVKENAVSAALDNLKLPPVLAVTDSQAFGVVSKLVPESVPLTSFSILLARMKGDLAICAEGAMAIAKLKPGSRVLIAEACTHHPIGEDIGRVKIPRWLEQRVGGPLEIVHVQGPDFPEDPSEYELVIHCGACTFNRKAVLSRILTCTEHHVPFTNYGVAIAYLHGILERTLSPFPEILDRCCNLKPESETTN